jgi:K+ transporter
MLLMVLFGASLVIGDGVLTPAMSGACVREICLLHNFSLC